MSEQTNPYVAFATTGSHDAEVAERAYIASEANAASPLFASLSTFNQSRALQYASELQLDRYEQILSFGQDAQQAMKKFTTKMLQHVQRNDTSRVRDVLHQLTEHLEKVNPDALIEEELGFIKRLFSRPKQSIQEVMSQYNRLSKQVDRLSIQLNHIQLGLLNDHQMLDDLYRLNEEFFQELNVYIAAAEMKRFDIVHNVLPQLQQQHALTADFITEQQLRDTEQALESLEKRIYDLQISREIAIQCAPQIRMIQQTGQMLMEKIQSSTMTTIPLWQNQIAMLLSMNNQRRVNAAQQRLNDLSDEMSRKNAKMANVQRRALGSNKLAPSQLQQFKETQQKLLQEIKQTIETESLVHEKQVAVEAEISHFK